MKNEDILDTKDWIKKLSLVQKVGVALVIAAIFIHFIMTIRFLLS